MKDLLTAEETAALLHLQVKRVQALARAGRLPAVRVGRRWLFPRERLTSLLGREARSGPAGEVELSARNQLRGVVREVVLGDVMAEVCVAIGDQELVAVITRESAQRLSIRPGAPVRAVIKATEVMIGIP